MQQITGTVQSYTGQNVKYSVSVGVYTDSGHTSLATIYSDNGITTAPNPFNTNENGGYSFYAADGSTYYLAVLTPADTVLYALQDVTLASTGGGGSGNLSGTLTTGNIPVASATNTLIDTPGFTSDVHGALSAGASVGTTLTIVSSDGSNPLTVTSDGPSVVFRASDINDANDAVGLQVIVTETDSTGAGAAVRGIGVSVTAAGTDASGATIEGVALEAINSATGGSTASVTSLNLQTDNSGTLSGDNTGLRISVGNVGTAVNFYGIDVVTPPMGTQSGITAAVNVENWGSTNYAIKTGTGQVSFGDHINQGVTKTFAGTCGMSTGTTCTFSITTAYIGTPICIVTAQGTDVTGGASACSVSGTTVTITATVANSNTWGAVLIGNPN